MHRSLIAQSMTLSDINQFFSFFEIYTYCLFHKYPIFSSFNHFYYLLSSQIITSSKSTSLYYNNNYLMEQYFANLSANCCKLDFSNKLAPINKYILSPKKTITNLAPTIKKAAKKSLKATKSHQALTNSKDINKSTHFQSINGNLKHKDELLNDYGRIEQSKRRTQTQKMDKKKQMKNSVDFHKIKQVKSLERAQVILSPKKTNQIEDMRAYIFQEKSNSLSFVREQMPLRPLIVKAQTNSVQGLRPQIVFTQAVPYFYREDLTPYNLPQNVHQPLPHFQLVPPYARSPPKYQRFREFNINPYIDYPYTKLTRPPLLKKQSSANYNQNFKRLYGQMEIQQQIKHDLMVSLEVKKKNEMQQDYSHNQDNNGVSILTKCPPSQESTILPPESKLRKKFQYQIDSLGSNTHNLDKKVGTQKFLKAQSVQTHKSQSLKLNRRQKFKSIVSVESEHSSSSAEVDSVIIDQRPYQLLSSNPIKSLL